MTNFFSFLFWDGGLKSVQSSSSGNSHLRWMRRAPIELGAGLAAPTDAINKSKAAWVVCSHDGFHNEVTMKCSLSFSEFQCRPSLFFLEKKKNRSPVKSSEGSTENSDSPSKAKKGRIEK